MIYRQVALERLSSPEQLDQLMKVTRPTGWMALGSLSLVLLSALAWGIFGSIPEKAMGTGVLIRTGGVYEVPCVGAGRLLRVRVKPGDQVQRGSVVANLLLPDLEIKTRNAEKNLQSAQEYYRQVLDFHRKGATLDVQDEKLQGATLESSIKWYGEQGTLLEERVKAQETLLADGLISVETVLSTRQSLAETRRQQDAARLQLERIGASSLQSSKTRTQELLKAAQEVAQAQHQLDEVALDFDRKSQVFSPYSGRVIEVFFEPGALMNAGETLFSLEDTTRELFGTIWVGASDGKAVRTGMTVQLAPSGVKQEEHGFLLGRVAAVSPYPSTTRAMKSLLANDVLIKAIESQGPSVAVRVELAADRATRSGYRWTSAKGPDVQLTSGTVCGANVITDTKRPITLVVPLVRRTLGI